MISSTLLNLIVAIVAVGTYPRPRTARRIPRGQWPVRGSASEGASGHLIRPRTCCV